MISTFCQWPIRIIPKNLVVYHYFPSIPYSLAISRTHRSLSITTTRVNTTKLRDERSNICMLPYHWMIFSGVMLIAYCINGRSEMMSLDLQYINAHCLIPKNIKDYIFPRKLKLPPERYKKLSYFHVRKNPMRRKSGQRLMCLNSSRLRSNDNIKLDSDYVDVFLDTCVIAGATPFKHDFLPKTFVPTIENMER